MYRHEGKINDLENAGILICWSMVFLTYTFLELFRASNKKTLKLQNLGDTIGYFREQYLVCIAKFVYSYTEKWVSLNAAISKLGLAA